MDGERPAVAETVVDVSETIVDDELRSVFLAGDLVFDAVAAAASEGRMASCVSSEAFTIHTDEVIGSGSQGIVVYATDSAGARYAAKISYPLATARERRNRKTILKNLVSLMDEHPFGPNHYKQTHLMPVYAYGKIKGQGSSDIRYDVAIMALCDSSLGDAGGCSYEEIRRIVLPQAADGLRALHAQGIVHRDIKPKNLYRLEGSIVLGDYGISSLLDEGKDTGATVFDKRTPGYSPHSSVVQRENDWYALGYTIWTLYNDGKHPHQALIDAGDLSAVLAGKRPVEFVPHAPNEASLGELIYGLTLEASRGRLGYEAIQEWLDDPATFHFESPFDVAESMRAYQFRGCVYSNNADLAEAMAEHWSDASEHIRSGTLGDFLKSSGQHDLAVLVHKALDEALAWNDYDFGTASAVTALKGSSDEFAWKGRWHKRAGIADEVFARLSSEPSVMYECASDLEKVHELLRFLIVAYVGDSRFAQEEAVVRAAQDVIPETGSSDVILRVDNLLVMFEALCSDKAAVRQFFIEHGPFGDAVWVKQHIAAYRGTTKEAERAIAVVRERRLPFPEQDSIERSRTMLRDLDASVQAIYVGFPANPYVRMLGLREDAAVSVGSNLAYRVAVVYGERCTLGYALSLTPLSKRDSLCDFDSLREGAAREARGTATRIREMAQTDASSPAGGHSKLWHLFLMVCTVLVIMNVWDSFGRFSQDVLAGFETHAPTMEAAGGIVPDSWLDGVWASNEGEAPNAATFEVSPATIASDSRIEPMSSCSLGLNAFLAGFTIAGICVLLVRIIQLVSMLFASFIRKRKLRNAERLTVDADRLMEMPLSESIVMLLDDRRLPSERTAFSTQSHSGFENEPLEKATRLICVAYRFAVVLLIVGVVLATVTWVPLGLAHLSASNVQALMPMMMLAGQASLLFAIGIYCAIVLKVGKTRPNMLVVVFLSFPLPFLMWFC